MPQEIDGEEQGKDKLPINKLLESEARFRAITEKVSDITAILDSTGIITYCSPSIKVLGYLPEDLEGRLPQELVHPNDLPEVEKALNQTGRNPYEPVIVHEIRVRTKTGEWSPLEGVLTGMPDQPGINGIVFKGYDISRRKLVEAALDESKQKLKSILASISDLVFGLDPNGIFIDFHQPEDHTELPISAETILGKSYTDVLPPHPAELLKTAIEKAVSTGNVQKFVYPVEIKEETFWFETKVSTRRGIQGEYNGITVVSRDITERKKVEQELQKSYEQLEQRVEERTRELQESESKFRELFNNMKSGVAFYQVVDNGNDFIFTDFNRAAERIEHLKKENLVGKSVLEIFPSIKKFGLFDIFHRVWETGKPEFHPTTLYQDGRIRGWRENYICKLPSGEVVAIYTDVTERQEAQEALKKSEERLTAFMDSATEAFFLLDSDLIFTNVNKRGLEILGKKIDQVLGQKLGKIIPDAKDHGKYNRILDIMKTGNPFTIDDYSFPTPLMELKGILKCFKVGDGLGVMFIDTTESKRLEEQLRHAQKMKAIGNLAGGIAHDFNNILGIIMGYTELATEGLPDGAAERNYLLQVLSAADRAKELVAQILAFSRKGEKERNPILLKDIVIDTTKLLRSILPTTIDIRSHIEEPLGHVLANPTQMHQVVMNICTNAAHAMKEKGGILEIILKEVDLEPDPQNPENPGPVRYQRLTFSDTGHGMPADIMERIFDPYFTTKKTGEGSGMGLAVVHGIVKSHKGDISVYSETGKGTTFQVYLPVTSKTAGKPEHKLEAIKGGNERVLFVDDESHLAKMGEKLLQKLGYSVTATTSSAEALEIFRRRPDDFDIIISDQTMPKMTGLQMIAEIRKIRPAMPVILCTGFSESVNEENFREFGIDGFAMKPLLLRDFALAIRNVLDRKSEK